MEKNRKYYIYVLLCNDQTLYTGYTTDVFKRFETHCQGKGAKYTKVRRPLKLLYFEEFSEKSAALKAEYAFKKQSRLQKIAYLKKHGVKF